MKFFRIHPSPNEPWIVTIGCDGDETHALILARRNPWVCQQMTDEAVARETTELWEEPA